MPDIETDALDTWRIDMDILSYGLRLGYPCPTGELKDGGPESPLGEAKESCREKYEDVGDKAVDEAWRDLRVGRAEVDCVGEMLKDILAIILQREGTLTLDDEF